MKIKGWLESSLLDWPGKIASVVFLPGCNLRCPYCHNGPLVLDPGALPDVSLEDILGYCLQRPGWIDGIVVTGGEPTLHPDLSELLAAIRRAGLKTKLDTNGTRPGVLARLLDEGLLDHVAMDVKAPLDPERYAALCGTLVRVSDIGESISRIVASGVARTFRTTVVPGLLSEEDVAEIARAVEPEALVLQAFRPEGTLDPSLERLPPLDEAGLAPYREAVRRARREI